MRGQGTSEAVQIDHVVALSDAWQKGAQGLDAARRRLRQRPAEPAGRRRPAQLQKGDGDAATWLPPNKAYRCAYVARQVAVKVNYGLWMTQAEKRHRHGARLLPERAAARRCRGARSPARGRARPGTPAGPRPEAGSGSRPPRQLRPHRGTRLLRLPSSLPFKNCTEAWAAGAAPVHVGDPGYVAPGSTATATASGASDSGPPPGTSVPVRRAPDPRSTGHPALGHPTAEEKRPEASRTGAPGPHAHSWEAAVAHIEGEVLIRRPVEEVFDFVADQRTEPTYNSNMQASEKITEGPIDVGTRFRATIRAGRRLLPMDIEYTGLDRPHRIASTTHMSTADFSGSLTFTPTPDGTRLRWSWQTRPKGAVRLLAPVLTLIGARQERRMWTTLRDHLEARSQVAH